MCKENERYRQQEQFPEVGLLNPWKNSRVAPLLVVVILVASVIGAGVATGEWSASLLVFCWIGLIPGLLSGTIAFYRHARLPGIFTAATIGAFVSSVCAARFLSILANL